MLQDLTKLKIRSRRISHFKCHSRYISDFEGESNSCLPSDNLGIGYEEKVFPACFVKECALEMPEERCAWDKNKDDIVNRVKFPC